MTTDEAKPQVIKDWPLPSVGGGNPVIAGLTGLSLDSFTPQTIPNTEIPTNSPASDIISTSINTQTRRILGNFQFESLGAITIGQIKISPTGILATDTLGNSTFTLDANTGSVTMVGTLAAGSIVSGYIQVGGAAGDVNSGSTTINGGKITASTVTATQISVSQLSAIAVDCGTLTAGTINGVTIKLPNESLGTGNAGKLIWAVGSRIWADSSGRIGFYSAGSADDAFYFYANTVESAIISHNSQAVFHYGIHLDNSSNLNVDGSTAMNALRLSNNAVENNITDVNIIKGYNDVNLQLGSNSYHISFYNTGFTEVAYVDSSGNIHKNGTVSFDITHPTKPGYRLKYPSVEAPEVALQLRGIAKLVNGVAHITTPSHWELVTEEALTTVVLTPLGITKGLYVPKESLKVTEFDVRAMDPSEHNTEFMWQLTAVRKGYKDFQAEYPNDVARQFKLAQEKHWKGEEMTPEEQDLYKKGVAKELHLVS